MNVSLKSTLIVLSLSLLSSCGKHADSVRTFRMGEKVEVGSLVYTVVSADWRPELGDGNNAKDRFLVIQLSVTNGGGSPMASPLTHLIDAQGKEYGELQEVRNFSQWMGLIRNVSPASTESGAIVFDVPLAIYKLKVSDGNVENEKSAQVEIPLELNGPATAPTVSLPGRK